jgi:formate dehydrogenase major subunit
VVEPKKDKETSVLNSLAKSIVAGNPVKDSAAAGISQKELTEAAQILSKAKQTIVVYGEGILQQKNAGLIAALYKLAAVSANSKGSKPRVISLKRNGNSRGAWDMGIANSSVSVINNLAQNGIKALYLLLADDYAGAKELPALLKGLDFLVVQTSYLSPLAQKADVVLPSLTWTEISGDYSTLDGTPISASRLVKPPEGVKADWDTISEIAKRFK